jgi:hypothetical protein
MDGGVGGWASEAAEAAGSRHFLQTATKVAVDAARSRQDRAIS